MKIKTILLSLALLVLCSTTLYAKTLSLGVKASTLGIGPEVEVSLLDFLGIRSGANFFKYNYDGTKDDVKYDFDLKLNSVPVLLDIHPFKGSFRITGGVLFNRNKIDAESKSQDTFQIGDTTYNAADLGKLNGKVTFNDTSPYAGLGWDTSFGKDNAWGFTFELGAVFQGSPEVELSASGPIADQSNPLHDQFQQDLSKEEDNMQDDLDKYKYYPVIGLGINYRF